MSSLARTTILCKSIQQLGIQPVLQLALHQLGYLTGHYYRLTRNAPSLSTDEIEKVKIVPVLAIPSRDFLLNDADCIPAAEEIVAGKFHPFSGDLEELDFAIPNADVHWTRIGDSDPQNDLKLIWEPARFCWVSPLIRAFIANNDPRYVRVFWENWHAFQSSNTPYDGPNWVSAQEVAIRLINWTFALQFFGSHPATRKDEKDALIQGIYQHACRIPCTINYAKAQKNNHLLTEAAGLYTAGCLFKHLPVGQKWMQMGWQFYMEGIASQIDSEGTYIQHSINYHRLMLQTAFWMAAAARTQNMVLPPEVQSKLADATRWLLAYLDPLSGKVPNLGHNDGTYLFPLTDPEYSDYRATAQTAACMFMNKKALPDGPWNEMIEWFNSDVPEDKANIAKQIEKPTALGSPHLWANIHMAKYSSRPAHADQLHVDLWWDGVNIIQDAGTYRYTASPPWDNRLARSAYHNTMTIDDKETMLWAGRFLWLDWDQFEANHLSKDMLTAFHSGYKRYGIHCKRTVRFAASNQVEIKDNAEGKKEDLSPHLLRLHWLFPDWEWRLEDPSLLFLKKPDSNKQILVEVAGNHQGQLLNQEIQIMRAGQVLLGQEDMLSPTLGWVSPTYNLLKPALSLRITFRSKLPVSVTSKFTFSQD